MNVKKLCYPYNTKNEQMQIHLKLKKIAPC